MHTRLIHGLSVAFVIFALLLSRASAQLTTAAVVGTITDNAGAAVPNAKVAIESVETHQVRSTDSNAGGSYVFDLLSPGSYVLTVQAESFRMSKLSFAVVAGQRALADVQIQPGATTQTVEVKEAALALQTQSATVGSVVTEQAVQDLPLNGRNYLTLVQTTPGANSGPGGGVQTGQRPDDRRQTSSVSANGQSEAFNNNLIDGMDNNEMEQGEILLRPSVDAIAEVEVNTNNYSADVGRSAGAVINVVTKSGTNAFHGSVYEYLRNDILNANDYFSKQAGVPRSELRQNQYGASLGGPIVKDKTFFFSDIEQYRIVQGVPSGLVTVPTLYEEQNPGDLSDIGGPVIPANQIDPVALKYFQLFPAPNIPGAGATNNYAATPRYTQNSTTVDVRIDQHLPRDTLFGRYSYNPVTTYTPAAFPAVDGVQGGGNFNYPGQSSETGQGVQVNDVHTFSPNLLLELRGGLTRLNILSRQLNYGTNAATKFGMPNADVNGFNSGLPPVLVSGYAPLGDNNYVPIADVNNVFQANGAVTYTRGKHELVTGAAVIRRQLNYYQAPAGEGQFNFSSPVPQSLADFLQGRPTTISRQMPLYNNYMRAWEPSAFVQDNWRARQWLTLNLGLRWDYFSPVTNAHNQRSNLDLHTLRMVVASSSNPSAGVQPDHKDFSPRLGFAATLGHGTVVRGGFGFSYFPPDDSGSATNLPNPPYYYLFFCQPGSSTQGLICPSGIGTLSQGPPLPALQSIAPDALSGFLNALPSHNPSSYIEQFNLTFQKEFGNNVVTASYLGELGRHLPWSTNADAPLPSTNPSPSLPFSDQLPNVAGVYTVYPVGGSSYNAAQVTLEHRMSKGLSLMSSYTYDSNLNNIPDPGTWETLAVVGLLTNNPGYDWGYSDNAARHLFNLQANYTLPFAKSSTGFRRLALGGWQVNAIAFYTSGIPFTVVDSAFASAPINQPGLTTDRPDVVAGQSFGVRHHTVNRWFNTAAFTPQPFGHAGNEARNQLWGPPNRQLDVSTSKMFHIRESLQMQFRAESFNLTNTANFNQPNAAIGEFDSAGIPTTAASFGQITSTRIGSAPRQFQFALKLLF
jgi:hypothetical protein